MKVQQLLKDLLVFSGIGAGSKMAYVCCCNGIPESKIKDLTIQEYADIVKCGKCVEQFLEINKVQIKLFIDDIRMPSDVGFKDSDFIVARNWFSARQMIDKFKPQFISFDHDLGDDSIIHDMDRGAVHRTGMDIAKWLVEQDSRKPDKMFITESFDFNVHSANPVGAENIKNFLDNYLDHKKNTK